MNTALLNRSHSRRLATPLGCFRRLAAIGLPRAARSFDTREKASTPRPQHLIGLIGFALILMLANSVLFAIYIELVPAIAAHPWK